LTPPPLPDIAPAIVRWQAAHGRRHLPWQHTRDPYRVWLSEIMLQQTQVATVVKYWQRFMAAYADVQSLAAAPQDAVLALWSGLGYYTRARNLHRCAREIVEHWGGQFPRRATDLATLPGIGRSTAAAIAAFCYAERVPILDANVRRVLCRVLAFGADPGRAAHQRQLWHWAEQLCPQSNLAQTMPAYTQGLMDLGASVCLPRVPHCTRCPVQAHCRARRAGNPQDYPVRARKPPRGTHTWWLLLAVAGHGAQTRVWLERRSAPGIWAGLYAPPIFDTRAALQSAATQCRAAPGPDNSASGGAPPPWRELPPFTHPLTHCDLHLHPVLLPVHGATPETPNIGHWASVADWPALGLPAPVRKLLDGIQEGAFRAA